jgi:hypothetical protein
VAGAPVWVASLPADLLAHPDLGLPIRSPFAEATVPSKGSVRAAARPPNSRLAVLPSSLGNLGRSSASSSGETRRSALPEDATGTGTFTGTQRRSSSVRALRGEGGDAPAFAEHVERLAGVSEEVEVVGEVDLAGRSTGERRQHLGHVEEAALALRDRRDA